MPVATADLKAIAATATEAVADMEEGALKEIAFARLLDHLLADSAQPAWSFDDYGDYTFRDPDKAIADLWPRRTEQQRADAVAHYFSIEPEQAVAVFDLCGDDPVVRSAETLSSPQLALMVLGVRAALGLDSDVADLRKAAACLDASSVDGTLSSLAAAGEIVLLARDDRRDCPIRLQLCGRERAVRAVRDFPTP